MLSEVVLRANRERRRPLSGTEQWESELGTSNSATTFALNPLVEITLVGFFSTSFLLYTENGFQKHSSRHPHVGKLEKTKPATWIFGGMNPTVGRNAIALAPGH